MKTALVTGATGFLGSALVEHLLDRGKRVIGVGRRDSGFLSDRVVSNPQFTLCKLDLTQDVRGALSGYTIDTIFHLAAQQPSSPNLGLDDFYKGNVATTRNVIALAQHCAKQLVYISTISVWSAPPSDKEFHEDVPPTPNNYYSLTKYIAERLIEIELAKTDVQRTIVRFPSLYGRNHLGGMIYTYVQLAQANTPIEVYGNGQTARNALYVGDAIEVLYKVAENKEKLAQFEMFLAGSVNSLPMAKIAQQVKDALGSSSLIVPIDKPSSPSWDVHINIEKAKNQLAFAPMTLEEGIQHYIKDILRDV